MSDDGRPELETIMKLFATHSQTIAPHTELLAQSGAGLLDERGRPPNSWAVVRRGYSVLVDAPFVWVLDSIALLADGERPPWALVLTGAAVAASCDAMGDVAEGYAVPVCLSSVAARDPGAHKMAVFEGVTYVDPACGGFLERAGLRVLPADTCEPGTIMLWHEAERALLAGDAARGEPSGSGEAGRLSRPATDDGERDEACRSWWRRTIETLRPDAILPLRGLPAARRRDGEQAYRRHLANLWDGQADPVPFPQGAP